MFHFADAKAQAGVIVTRKLVYPGTHKGFTNSGPAFGFARENSVVAVDDVKNYMEFFQVMQADDIFYTDSYEEAVIKAEAIHKMN